MRAYIKFKYDDTQYNEWKRDEYGIVESYVCQYDVCYAVVILEKNNNITLARLSEIEFVKYVNQ